MGGFGSRAGIAFWFLVWKYPAGLEGAPVGCFVGQEGGYYGFDRWDKVVFYGGDFAGVRKWGGRFLSFFEMVDYLGWFLRVGV